MCNKTISPTHSKNKTTIISISIVVPMVVVVILALSCLIWRRKRKPKGAYADLFHCLDLPHLLFTRYKNDITDMCATSLYI
jgi:hypothetical protein